MTFSVIDTATTMTEILDAPAERRVGLVRAMWAPMAGMYSFVPSGVDLAEVHRQGFGFPWDSAGEAVRKAVRTLVEADAWGRAERALEQATAALEAANPGIRVPDVTLLLVVGDPDDPHFIDEIQGLSAFGGISGFITLTLWPTPLVLDRIEAIVSHELHHNVRYTPGGIVWDPATVTVGEQIVAEGLADVFATEFYGERGYTHFVADETRTNDGVLDRVVSGLDVTGMQNFTSWVHGDASARVFGAEPAGLPTGAGYAAGARLVTTYLDATGGTAAANVQTPAADIIRIATGRPFGRPAD